MKKIEAIINPSKLGEVTDALDRVGIEELSVSRVAGCGHQTSQAEACQNGKPVAAFVAKLKIEMLVHDYKAAQVVEAIKRAARTWHAGAGKVFVLPVDEAMCIRTGGRGSQAV